MDADLLTAAAQASPPSPRKPAKPTKEELAPLIAALPEQEKDALLLRLVIGPEPRQRTELLHRLSGTTTPATVPGRRSAAHLLDAAHTRRTDRRHHAEHDRAEARARHLTALASEAESIWQRIEAHIATKKTTAYDQAVVLLAELLDAYAHTGRGTDFHQRLPRLCADYQRRPRPHPPPRPP